MIFCSCIFLCAVSSYIISGPFFITASALYFPSSLLLFAPSSFSCYDYLPLINDYLLLSFLETVFLPVVATKSFHHHFNAVSSFVLNFPFPLSIVVHHSLSKIHLSSIVIICFCFIHPAHP